MKRGGHDGWQGLRIDGRRRSVAGKEYRGWLERGGRADDEKVSGLQPSSSSRRVTT